MKKDKDILKREELKLKNIDIDPYGEEYWMDENICLCIKDYTREHFGKLFDKNESYEYEIIKEGSEDYFIVYDGNSKLALSKDRFNEFFKN